MAHSTDQEHEEVGMLDLEVRMKLEVPAEALLRESESWRIGPRATQVASQTLSNRQTYGVLLDLLQAWVASASAVASSKSCISRR